MLTWVHLTGVVGLQRAGNYVRTNEALTSFSSDKIMRGTSH